MVIENHWSHKPGAYGKGLKKWVLSEIGAELETTYVGAGSAENWDALFRTIHLFRKVALEVADHFTYHYPLEMDQRVVAYLEKVSTLDKHGSGIP